MAEKSSLAKSSKNYDVISEDPEVVETHMEEKEAEVDLEQLLLSDDEL